MSTQIGNYGLLTDLYELTMAYGYWRHGKADCEAVFHLSYRENPFGGSFAVACGLERVVEMLHDFHYGADEVQYLASLTGGDGRALFADDFLTALRHMRLTVDIDAVEEGCVVFPHEPLLRVQGPLWQAQIIESLLLNVINFQTLIATKASRICHAAGDGQVLEFGLRRAQGEDGSLAASRAAYIGGCSATSNVLAGSRYGIPVRGTHAHSWVLSFDSELESFAAYAEVLPNNCIFLVDTFDTLQGVANAITVAGQLRTRGHALVGIRLDSGDLAQLSQQARRMLDAAQLQDALIVASNDLDEYEISRLRAEGARIDVWGVGTRLVTAHDQPALGGVYKLAALRSAAGHWEYKLKLSEHPIKVSIPGILQTRRYLEGGRLSGDIIYDRSLGIAEPPVAVTGQGRSFRPPAVAETRELLVPVFRGGELVYQFPSIHQRRRRALDEAANFRQDWDRPGSDAAYPVALERRLSDRKLQLMESLGAAES